MRKRGASLGFVRPFPDLIPQGMRLCLWRPLTGALALLAAPAAAQTLAPQTVTLIDGVVFAGEGAVELVPSEDGTAVARFWRPLQYSQDNGPIGGRMECRAAAQRGPFRAAMFQPPGLYAAEVKEKSLGDFTELDTRAVTGPIIRRLDVLGRRRNPLRYEVRSYIAVRTGSDLVSLRETCQFLRNGQIFRQNFFQYVDRHTSFVLALAPPDTENPAATPSLDSLTEVPS